MPYVLAGSHLEFRQFLTEHGLSSSTHTYLSGPEQLLDYNGIIILVGSYPLSDLWDTQELDKKILERRTMTQEAYLALFKEQRR